MKLGHDAGPKLFNKKKVTRIIKIPNQLAVLSQQTRPAVELKKI